MSTFIVERSEDGQLSHRLESEAKVWMGEGDMVVAVSHSSLNYKDAMALDGNKGVMRANPLVPGIDVIGTVVDPGPSDFAEGDLVTCQGDGLGEFRHGGYTSRQRVNAAATVAVPESMSAAQAAAIGTAGFTAALCVNALLKHGVGEPGSKPIAVTGATGGVGSIAVNLLSNLGYEVHAITGRVDEHGDYLRQLGAAEVIDRASIAESGKPLQKTVYAGAVDTLGGAPLANLLAQVQWGGVVAATGMAASPSLETSVMPFILRNVTLAGVNSVDAPLEVRQEAWDLLGNKLDLKVLDSLTTTVDITEVAEAAGALLEGKNHGRTVVTISA